MKNMEHKSKESKSKSSAIRVSNVVDEQIQTSVKFYYPGVGNKASICAEEMEPTAEANLTNSVDQYIILMLGKFHFHILSYNR